MPTRKVSVAMQIFPCLRIKHQVNNQLNLALFLQDWGRTSTATRT